MLILSNVNNKYSAQPLKRTGPLKWLALSNQFLVRLKQEVPCPSLSSKTTILYYVFEIIVLRAHWTDFETFCFLFESWSEVSTLLRSVFENPCQIFLNNYETNIRERHQFVPQCASHWLTEHYFKYYILWFPEHTLFRVFVSYTVQTQLFYRWTTELDLISGSSLYIIIDSIGRVKYITWMCDQHN